MTNGTGSAEVSPDADKSSKRDRFRDALTRTRSKFKKERVSQEEFKLSDDVNDFLAAGRNSVTTPTRSPAAHSSPFDPAPRPPTSESLRGRPPSRGAAVPKIDVSQSQRWPNARVVDDEPQNGDHLYPGRRERSHSFGAIGKKRPRPRGLSVSFDNRPPVIIGEGGDEAQSPPNEITSAKQRSRSLSPLLNRPGSMQSNSPGSQSPIRRKPVSPRAQLVEDDQLFKPKPIRRTQTGMSMEESPKLTAAETLERQLQQALNLDQLGSRHPAQVPAQAQRSRPAPPALPSSHHGQRLDTVKPINVDLAARHYPQPTLPQYAPRPTVQPGNAPSQFTQTHRTNDKPVKPSDPGPVGKSVYKNQELPPQQPPPHGWI